MENDMRKSSRGFASMDKSRQREIASKGGRAAHERGTAHEFDSSEAATAARRGHARGTAHEFTSDEARIAGRKGGLARAAHRGNTQAAGHDSPSTPLPDNERARGHIESQESVLQGAQVHGDLGEEG